MSWMTISKPRSGHVQLQAIIHSNLNRKRPYVTFTQVLFFLIHFFLQRLAQHTHFSLSHTYTLICVFWLDTKTLKKFNSKGTRLSLIFLPWIDGRPGVCVCVCSSGLYRSYWKKGEESVWKWHLIKEGDTKKALFRSQKKNGMNNAARCQQNWNLLFHIIFLVTSVFAQENGHAHYTM